MAFTNCTFTNNTQIWLSGFSGTITGGTYYASNYFTAYGANCVGVTIYAGQVLYGGHFDWTCVINSYPSSGGGGGVTISRLLNLPWFIKI